MASSGRAQPRYGSTGMNERSSRSHVIFRMVIEKLRSTSDLNGSERSASGKGDNKTR